MAFYGICSGNLVSAASGPEDAVSQTPATGDQNSRGRLPSTPDPVLLRHPNDAERIELQPYRVVISLAISRETGWSSTEQAAAARQLALACQRFRGPMWNAVVQLNSPVFPASPNGLARVSAEGPAQWPGSARPAPEGSVESPPGNTFATADKIFLLTISRSGSSWQLAGREWDRTFRRLGPVLSREASTSRTVVEQLVLLLGQLETPELQIDGNTGDLVQLTLRAGRLPVPDTDAAPLGPGSILVPSYRYLDRQGEVRRIDRMPWTWLIVESVDEEQVTARMVSALRAALGTGSRRRVQALASGVGIHFAETRVQLVRQNARHRPLIARDVSIARKRLPTDENEEPLLRLITDRNGRIRIPADDTRSVVWLYVHSDSRVLARLPLVPGAQQSITVPIPEDTIGLQIEGELQLLQNELIDTVARRAGLSARLLRLARAGTWKTVDELLPGLNALPVAADFQSRLTTITVPAQAAARKAGDRRTLARINQLIRQQEELIKRYLDPDRLRLVREELAELRRLDRDSGLDTANPTD